jgi:hypothetical protein
MRQNAASMSSREYLLAELRCTLLRLKIAIADVIAIGIALKAHAITPDDALALLHDADVPFRLIGTLPSERGLGIDCNGSGHPSPDQPPQEAPMT